MNGLDIEAVTRCVLESTVHRPAVLVAISILATIFTGPAGPAVAQSKSESRKQQKSPPAEPQANPAPQQPLAPQPPQQAATQATVLPIFNELIMFTEPPGFQKASEKFRDDRYYRESVPAGQSLEQSPEIFTVTAAKGLAAQPGTSPKIFVEQIGSAFRKACPETYTMSPLGVTKIDGRDAYAAWAACGTVKGANPRGEAALLIALKGKSDMYSVQWAFRGAPSPKALPPVNDAWQVRLKAVNPIRLCPVVAGEKAPYASCLNRK